MSKFTDNYVTLNKEKNSLTLLYEGNNTDILMSDVIEIYDMIGELDQFKKIKIFLKMRKNVPVELCMVLGQVSNHCMMDLFLMDKEAYDKINEIISYSPDIMSFKSLNFID